MIYLDNAATTVRKPDSVVQAVTETLYNMGNAGRGVNQASLDAARKIFDTRMKLTELFHGENPNRLVFTLNSTEALNTAIKGVLQPGDHVITTELEHNSVLRPLYEMEAAGVELTILKSDQKGRIQISDVEKAFRKHTKLIFCTHGSNVTGNLVNIKKIGEIAKERGALFGVDASQTAGCFPVDVQMMQIDLLCFTGHKGLLGPQGTGGLYVREGVTVRPLKSGGSGVQTYSRTHPVQMPTALEAGTLNGHGIAGLGAAVAYLQETGLEVIRKKEQELMWRFYEQVRQIPGVTVYGDFEEKERCPIVTLNLWDCDSAMVSDALFMEYEICTRAGAHCAPLMHRALGTEQQGGVRFSFSYYNTGEEVDRAVQALWELSEEYKRG